MYKIYTDPNMENDNTEHIKGKRLSSILKAPRNPLDDLGNGNELTQDINIEKRRKSSRRVSFANTINCRVFESDLKNNTAERESTECAAETRLDVLLNQNEGAEVVPCEITGMDTLLHAPIQASVQQSEWHDVDTTIPRADWPDTTLIFSEANEMDMTSSHPAAITRNLQSSHAEEAEKIDITSFLAGLSSNNGKAETSKEFTFFSDPTNQPCPAFEQKEDATAVKKINFNDFLMSLKSNGKAAAPVAGPEKENVFFLPSQDVARAPGEFVHSSQPLDTCNVTKFFRGQEGGMEMTKCQGSHLEAVFAGGCEAPPGQLLCGDVTEAFLDDGMDMTTSHTAKVSFPFSSLGNQSLNFKKDFPSTELDNSVFKRASDQHLLVQQGSQLCADSKLVPVEGRGAPAVLRAANQEPRRVSAIPGAVSSDTVFRGDKTVVFSKCDDMEITGNYTDLIYSDSTKETNSSHHKAFERPVHTKPLLTESRCRGEVTKALTPLDNGACVPYKNGALELSVGSEGRMERVSQDPRPALLGAGWDSGTGSASAGVSQSRVQHRPPDAQPVSRLGEKTVLFSGEDMDLTKTCAVKDDGRSVESQSAAGVFSSVTCKPHFLQNRSTSLNVNEREEMEITKCHPVVIDDQSSGTTAEAKQMPCKMIPRKNQNKNVSEGANSLVVDKENLEVMNIPGDMRRSQAMEMNTRDPEVIMVDKRLGKANFQASSLSSCAKSMRPLQEQKREVPENIVPDASVFVSLQRQDVVSSQALGANLLKAPVPCTGDRMGMFSDDQTRDITKMHPAAFDVAPFPTVQEYENYLHHNNEMSRQLQSQTFLFSGHSGGDLTSWTPAVEGGGLEMNTNGQSATALAPSSWLISSSEPAPSGMKGNGLLGATLGINTNRQTSERRERSHALRAVHRGLPTRAASEGGFSAGKTFSSEKDFPGPCSGAGLPSRRAEGPAGASASEPQQGRAHLPAFLERPVLFPSGENMDLTGNCGVMVPGCSVDAALPEREAAPGYHAQGENKVSSCREGAVMAKRQEQPVHHTHHPASGRKPVTTAGSKHLPFAGEKTSMFSEDADMDITRSHTVSADKLILQHKSLNDERAFTSGEQTRFFTYNDDMEISRLDTGVIDKSVEKVVSQGILNMAKRAGRKSLKGTPGEKTVLFSLTDGNNDMEITASHTAAIGHEIILQSEGGLRSVSSAHPVKAVPLTSSQAAMDITQSCSAGKATVKGVCAAKPGVDEEAGRPALAYGEATVFAGDEMEITRTHTAALEERCRQPTQPLPGTPTVMFTGFQADMEMTGSHSVDASAGRVFAEGRLNLAQQAETTSCPGSKTLIFTLAEDMEITQIPSAVLSGDMDGQDSVFFPAASAVPPDKTIVFTHTQDDMEITASHTIAVNNNINGFENQEAPRKSTQQPDSSSALLPCRDETDPPHTKDLNGEYHTKSEDKGSAASSAPSPPAFPSEKGALQVPSGTTPDSTHSVSLPEETPGVWAPRDLDLPLDNPIPAPSQQGLLPPEDPESKRLSFKPPSNRPMDCSEESGDLGSGVSHPIQQQDSLKASPDAGSAQRNQVLKGDSSGREDLGTDSGLAGASLGPASNREPKAEEGLAAEGQTPPKDLDTNPEQTKQLLASDIPGDPAPVPELSGILSVCSKLKNIRRKSTALSVSETAFPDQLPESIQPEDALTSGGNTGNEPDFFYTKEQENPGLESEAAPVGVNFGMALKDKYQGLTLPLGIFQPKLPSRRNPSVSSIQGINAKSAETGEAPGSEGSVKTDETPGTSTSSRQHFSPLQFIAEEFFPVCLEEMDSSESVNSELVQNVYDEITQNQLSPSEEDPSEETTCNNTKRALEEDKEDLQSPKKVKRDDDPGGEASQDLQVTIGAVSQSQAEVHEGEDPPNLLAKSPDCTHASTSSSLDSVKADTEFTVQRSSQMESLLLTDSICEDNLREKFQSGVITVGEFLTLLQVHVPIQKPRRSHVPANCAVSAAPTPRDLLYSQYIDRPKLRVYEEDCRALSQRIEELKEYTILQDELLVNVNKGLWEVMRTCSDEELKNFGAELNKMKSCFTKESKILAHNEKETLYSKLLQSTQEQHEKLQSRLERVDELVKEAESCLAALEADSDWEEWEADCGDGAAEGKSLGKELKSLKAQEEELQRELLGLEAENEQMLVQMDHLREEQKRCQELVEAYDFMEWELTEWSSQQAVFSFLYDALELTVLFEPPVDGDDLGEDPSRKIVSLNFESLLDEEKAPPSSCLVQRLIFQFIESQGCWQEKCPTLCYLSQVLHEVSLVVSRCKVLGEEIEFLERWGGKFNLLKTEVDDTGLKLLFSASTAFAKFELTLALSSTYPSAPLPFTVRKLIGNLGEEEVSSVLSKVPVGHHYLRRIVSSIHQDLLWGSQQSGQS